MTTTLRAVDEDHCAVCGESRRCVLIAIADDAGDLSRSALTLRTVTTAVCRPCIDHALTPRNFARSRFDACPVTDRAES